jgi:hypothetical protein
MVHRKKTLTWYFEAAIKGEKPFSVRHRKPRENFKVGDILLKIECYPASDPLLPPKPTGREAEFLITYILDLSEVFPSFFNYGDSVVLGIKLLEQRTKPRITEETRK